MNRSHFSFVERAFQFLLLISLIPITAVTAVAQGGAEIGTLDTRHFIPPFYARSGLSTTSDVRDQYLYLSTIETVTVTINVSDAGGLLGTVDIDSANPARISLINTAHVAPLGTTLPALGTGTAYGAKGIIDETGLNSIDTTNALVLESTGSRRFYANIRQKSGSQAASLTAKGQTAIGTEFRSGHLVSDTDAGNASLKSHFISVMALEDNTRVDFTANAGVKFVTTPDATSAFLTSIILDQYEAVTVGVNLDDPGAGGFNDIFGTLIQSSDSTGGSARRTIAVNTGSWHGANNPTGASRDVGFDQILPTDYLGTEFVVAKGGGTTNVSQHERPTIVAHTDNTQIFLNGSLTPDNTIDAGEFHDIDGAIFTTSGSDVISIQTSEPAYLYQSSNSNNSNNGQGLNFIPAVFPNLETQAVTIPDFDMFGTDAVNSALDIVVRVGFPIVITGGGGACVTTGPTAIPGTSVFEAYNIVSCTGNVTVDSASPFFTSLSVESGAVGAAGFFTGFPNSYAVRDSVVTGVNDAIVIDVIDNDIQGFFDFFIDSATTPANGTTIVNGDRTITYTPNSGYSGLDFFQYTIEDTSTGFQDTTLVTVQVTTAPGGVGGGITELFYQVEDTTGNVFRYDTASNLANNSGGTLVGTIPSYGDNQGFFSTNDGRVFTIIETTGEIVEYPSLVDFFNDTNSSSAATVAGYGDDPGFFTTVDGKVYVVTDAGDIDEYPSILDFIADTNSTTIGTVAAYANDRGFFTDIDGFVYAVNELGETERFPNIASFATNTGALSLGTTAAYGNDAGFFNAFLLRQNLVLWLKADTGVTEAAGEISQVDDQSGSANNASSGLDTPNLVTNAVNFNPGMTFANEEALVLNNAITPSDKALYVVFAPGDTTLNRAVFTDGVAEEMLFRFLGSDDVGSFDGTADDSGFDVAEDEVAIIRVDNDGGTDQTLRKNAEQGVSYASAIASGMITVGNNNIALNPQGVGTLVEIAVYDEATQSIDDVNQIESYLATKYGVTLNNADVAGADSIAEGDYVDTAGNVIWDGSQDGDDSGASGGEGANSNFHNNLAGIGRDDGSTLDQQISTSTGSGAILTVAHGNDSDLLDNVGAQSATAFSANRQYLMWGHNGSATSVTDVSAVDVNGVGTNFEVLDRTWKVQNSNSVGEVSLQFDLSGLEFNGGATLTLLRDDDGDFTSGATLVTANRTVTASEVNFTNVDFTDGSGEYFTLALQQAPEVDFTAATQSSAELNAGTSNFTVTAQLEYASNLTVTIPYTLGGGAENPADYTVTSSPVTITTGNTTTDITISVVGDDVFELDDDVVITMGTPTNGVQGTTVVHTATITNDDVIPDVISLVSNLANIVENGAGVAIFTATLSNASFQDVTINLNYSGTATNGADFLPSSLQIVILAGATTGTVSVSGVPDTLDEVNETVIVDVATVVNGTETAPQQATTTITDDDLPPLVDISVGSPSLAEAAGTANLTATLSAVSSLPVTVNLAYSGTSSGPGALPDDFAAATSIVVAAGTLSNSIVITANNDVGTPVDEPDETIVVDISSVTNGTESGTQQEITTILDDDAAPTVQLTPAPTSPIAENGGAATYTVALTGATSQAVTVDVAYSGTATIVTDYTTSLVGTTVTITPPATTAVFTVTGAPDALDEADETIVVDISNPSNATLGTTTQQSTTLTDDVLDIPPSISLGVAGSPLTEDLGSTATYTATLSAASGRDVTVTFALDGSSTADLGPDFLIDTAAVVVIPAGSLTATLDVTSAPDAIDESNETIVINATADFATGTPQSTATITDDDSPPTVSISIDSLTFSESAGTTVVTATLNAISELPVTVNLAYSGTATGPGAAAPNDYNGASAIVIAAGSVSNSLTLTGVGDLNDEADETIIVDIDTVSNGTENGTQQQTGTIIDDDGPPVVQLTPPPVSPIMENGGGSTYTVTVTGPTDLPVTVDVAYSGSAILTTDYNTSLVGSTITVTPPATTATFTITGLADVVDEADENAIVDISNPVNATLGATTQQTVVLNDDVGDIPPVLTLAATPVPPAGINEDLAGTGTYTATITPASGRDITVTFSVDGASTADEGPDYLLTPLVVVIPAGSTTAVLTATAAPDGIDEADETIIINAVADFATGTPQATTEIDDDDLPPTVDISVDNPTIAEDGGVATFTATLSAESELPVTVNFVFSGTAIETGAEDDYDRSATSVVIPAGSLAGSITVTSNNDVFDEDDETVVVDIGTLTNGTENGTQQAITTILDAEVPPLVTLSVDTATIAENGGVATFTATLNTASNLPVTVDLLFTGEAGGSGSDYTASAEQIVIAAGALSNSITVTGDDDAIDEIDERVVVEFDTITNGTEDGAQKEETLILDDDLPPLVSLAVDTATIAESPAGVAVFTATLNAVSSQDVTVDLGFSGEALGSGVDYSASGAQISILAGDLTGTISVGAVGDLIDENDEDIVVEITSTVNATEDGVQTATTTITDDDAPPSVTIGVDSNPIAENGGVATFTVTLSAVSGLPVTVDLGLAGTAGTGADYVASATQIVVAAGGTSGSITVTGSDDLLDENNETVIVSIDTVTNGTEVGTQAANTVINDDDAPPGVSLSIDAASILESVPQSAVVTATLDAVSELDVTVNFSYSGTATSGADFTGASQVTILAGSTTGLLGVFAQTDAIDEDDETIIVDISSVVNGTETGVQQVTTTIVDDDAAPTVTLAVSPATVSEIASSIATVTATLSAASEKAVTVDVGFTGAATTGVDYLLADGTQIAIPAGSTTGTVRITPQPDTLDEPDEVVTATITGATNATLGAPVAGSTTITDDDAPSIVFLTVNADPIAEAAGVATFTAELVSVSGFDITVDFGFSGTATGGGTDYTASAAQVTILAGDTSGSITVTANDDLLDEGDEVVTVDITNVVNGTELSQQQQSTTITDDDDLPAVTLSVAGSPASENGGVATVTVTLDQVSALDVTVDLAFSGTAGGTEYTPSSSQVVVTAGLLTADMTITGVDDTLFEPDETVLVDVDVVTNGTEATPQQVTVTLTDDDDGLDADGDGKTNGDECPGLVFPCPDADGDGVPDFFDSAIFDTDGDGIVDELDDDADGDGGGFEFDGDECLNAPECADFDGDGIPDFVDIDDGGADAGDSDGDGILDDIECAGGWPCPDTDGDGLPDYVDDDSDNDGKTDADEGVADTDGDGIPDRNEPDNVDTDGDGVVDELDGDDDNVIDTLEDADGDDTSDECPAGIPCPDLDGDGIPSYLDADETAAPGAGDSDGDGIDDDVECPGGAFCPDSDGDLIPDYMDTDSDGDGESDAAEGIADDDGDGIPNRLEPDDVDSDGDGTPDEQDGDDDNNSDQTDDADGDDTSDECPAGVPCPDTDGDGIPDHLDADDQGPGAGDSDGDGIDDDVECPSGVRCTDTDGDGIPDYADLDSDGDGKLDADEGVSDIDGDGIPDRLESDAIDSDGDGTVDELDGDDDNAGDQLEDGDGDDTSDECPDGVPCPDTDGDGIPDYLDGDDAGPGAGDTDGDGVNDDVECPGGVICPDTDNDSIPDYADTDSDGDGIDDAAESPGDADGDGIDDRLESDVIDSDGDGLSDQNDNDSDGDLADDGVECPDTPICNDADGDGIPSHLDGDETAAPAAGDSDGDGIADDVECPTGFICADSDGDNIPDYADTDSDGDGILDSQEGVGDPDGDNIPNYLDDDSDGDSIPDATEGGGDSDGDGIYNAIDTDADNDTIPDMIDGLDDFDGDTLPNYLDTDSDDDTLLDSLELTGNPDGDTQPNYIDLDSDNDGILDSTEGFGNGDRDGLRDRVDLDSDDDGIPDNIEGQTIAGFIPRSGLDTDLDGLDDAYDTDNGGTPVPVPDNDVDGNDLADYRDQDSDFDLLPDILEAHDLDNDGVAETVPSGVDANANGLDDAFEFITTPADVNEQWRIVAPPACTDLTPFIADINSQAQQLRDRFPTFFSIRRSVSRACGISATRRRDNGISNRAQALLESVQGITNELAPEEESPCMIGSCVVQNFTDTLDLLDDEFRRLSRLARQQIRGSCTKENSARSRPNRRFIRQRFRDGIAAIDAYPDDVVVCN